MPAERLQKILARAGVASRRAAEELIRAGRVTVDGSVVRELGAKADPLTDDVRLDGERLRKQRLRYLALHKPVGVVTTLDDPERRTTVRDLLPPTLDRVYPVGRLDFHTSGLLLLMNDGDLAARLLHPRYQIPRTYRAKILGHLNAEALARLRKGVRIEEGMTGPARIDVERQLEGKTWLRITIREGKRREIRRMFEALGYRVERLTRIRFGPIELGRMRPGEWRPLAAAEVEALRDAVGRRIDAAGKRNRRA